LDIANLSRSDDYAPKSEAVLKWLKRKSLADLGVMVSENRMFSDDTNDLISINSMWIESKSRKK